MTAKKAGKAPARALSGKKTTRPDRTGTSPAGVPENPAPVRKEKHENPETPQMTEPEKPAEAEQVNILLVDDNPDQLKALESLLDKPGYRLVRAQCGEEALKRCLAQDFAVILMDVRMPGIDGFEAARMIRERRRSKDTPVIFVTGTSPSEMAEKLAYATGAVDYLYLPIIPAVLNAKVAAFADLFRKTSEAKHTAALLRVEKDRAETIARQLAEKTQEIEQANRDLKNANEELASTEEELHQQVDELAERDRRLTESERKFRETVQTLDEGYYSCTPEGVLLEHNAAFNRILGIDPGKDMKGAPLPDFWQDPQVRDTYLAGLKAEGSVRNFEIKARTVQGNNIIVLANAHAVRDGAGRLVRIEGTVADFTERIEVQEVLAEKSQLLEAMNEDLVATDEELRATVDELEAGKRRLMESEERFRISAQCVSDVIWDWNISDGRLDWYGRIDEMLGYAPGEFPRTLDAWEQIIHTDDRDRVMSLLDRHVKTQGPYAAEYRVVRKDGEIRHWIDKGSTMLDGNGVAYRMVGSCSDITERKRAEEELARLAAIVRYSDEAIIGKTLDGTITSWNEGAGQVFGYTAQEMIGKNMSLLVPPDCPDDTSIINDRIRNGKTVIRYETLRRRKDGRIINIILTASPIRDSENILMGISTIADDITERKRAEEALRQKTAELDGYFSNTLDLLCIADTNGCFRRLNREWESTLGYRLAELEGRRFLDFVHPDDVEGTLAVLSDLGTGKIVPQFTNRYRHKDGSYRLIEWRSFLVGNLIYASARDITERKRMSDQIEASLAEKETLLREIHHRVKNNLQIITSMLNMQIRKLDDPKTIEALRDSQNRVMSMALVHEHLYRGKDFSRIDLKNYIAALAKGLFQSYEAANDGVRFDLDIQDVYVDINTAIPLGLISNELITNSLKYAFRGKKDGKLSILATEDPHTLAYVVADNGPGMPAGITLENQASLGLRLVNSLTGQLQGTVAIDRTGGTKFTFVIPKTAENRGKAGP